MCAMRLTGYADKFSVHPGDKIKFYVNCDGPKKYSASIVQMINGDTNPRGPGFIEKAVKADCEGVYDGIKQVVYGGSYGFVADAPQLKPDSFTLQCWIWPTTPKTDKRYWKHGAQVVGRQGLRPVNQYRRLCRTAHQRRDLHDRCAAARPRLALHRGQL